MDLAVTSETVRCSYITRALNFSQGQRGDRLNKIRPVCSLMIPVPSNPQLGGPGAQGGGVCPPERQRVEVRRGPPTHQPDGGKELLYKKKDEAEFKVRFIC